ncbi:sporulation protein [Halobacillus campisalis]|uniref:Sporulation protein n=1 Tax=Halobacillus campisalis TaxID=435909 RepID=A0ABW2JZL5_9BACI|nr:sporulation protein [Halobacillus campisalis]
MRQLLILLTMTVTLSLYAVTIITLDTHNPPRSLSLQQGHTNTPPLQKITRRSGVLIARMFSYFKIGSPKIDLVLHSHKIEAGGHVSGSFHLYGGWFTQKIKRLECDLVKVSAGKSQPIQPVTTVLMSEVIEPRDQKEFPFRYLVPEALTPTDHGCTYRLQTKIVFEDDIKTFDHDELIVIT